MRRLLSKLRPVHIVVAAVLVLFLAWKGDEYAPDLRKSPFVLWSFRAGMRFRDLDEVALRHSSGRFACQEPMQRIRLCELRAAGIPGDLRVLVDASGRVASLQFRPDSASPIMREEGRRIAAFWNKVREGVGDTKDSRDHASTIRWSSADNRWAALMRYGRLGKTPFEIQLTDRSRLTNIANTTTLAATMLVMNAVAESTDVMPVMDDVSYALNSIRSGRALDASYETAVPASYVLLPACERTRLLLGATPGTPNERFTLDATALIESAFAKVYSGSRLVRGESAWLVDSSGQAERIRLAPAESDSASGIVALGVEYPSRTAKANAHLKEGRPETYCRAAADLVIAGAQPNGSLGNVYRIPIGEDAMASQISRIEIVPTSASGDAAHIRIRYTTRYGTYRWIGSIDWEGVIAGDPPRLRGRVPLGFAQSMDEAMSSKSGTLLITKRSEKSMSLGTLEQYDWGFATRTISIPVWPNGAIDGVRILDRLF
ncbi:MAG TPA: hypothetical protein VH762_05585 [Gemmatimonadaceae bacterium]